MAHVHAYVPRHTCISLCMPGCIQMLQDEYYILNTGAIFEFLVDTLWENSSLLNPYDVMCDIINDVMTSPKTYKRQSTLFPDIQHS